MKVVRARDRGIVWNKNNDGNCRSFLSFFQFLFEKTVTVLNRLALVLYPVQSILVTVSDKRTKWLIGKEHELLGRLSARCSQERLGEKKTGEDKEMSFGGPTPQMTSPLESCVWFTIEVLWVERWMTAISKAVKVVAGSV